MMGIDIADNEKTKVKLKNLLCENSINTDLSPQRSIQRSNSWPQSSHTLYIKEIIWDDKNRLLGSFSKSVCNYEYKKPCHDNRDSQDPKLDKKDGGQSYENIYLAKYSEHAAENFLFLQRYYLTCTLPNRNKMLLELRSLGVDRLNICLFGPAGCGKSALLNTMYGVMTSQYVEYSPERKLGKRYRECVTNRRIELRLTENISVVDNIGVDFSKASLCEMKKQCEGLREVEEEICPNWKSSLGQRGRDIVKMCNKRMLLRNRVHCPVIVSSITQELNKNAMKKLISVIKQASYCEPIIVVPTNIHDVESTRTYMAISRRSYFESLGCTRVHEVKLHTSSNHRHNLATDETIINVLFECCTVGDMAIAATLGNYKDHTSCC